MNSPISQELIALEPILGASRAELESLQLERLRATLRHAYANNANYTRKFDAANVHPSDLQSLADLARFPFTTKADLRDAYPFGFFAVPREQVARIHASSGTTGKPTVVGYTRNDLAVWGNLVARSIRAAGGRAGMKVHETPHGYGLFTGGLGAHYGAEAAKLHGDPHVRGPDGKKQVQLIRDFAPDIIMVTPSYAARCASSMSSSCQESIRDRRRCVSAYSAPNRGATACERKSNPHSTLTPAISTACQRSCGPGVAQEFARTKRRGRRSGKTTSWPKS